MKEWHIHVEPEGFHMLSLVPCRYEQWTAWVDERLLTPMEDMLRQSQHDGAAFGCLPDRKRKKER